MNVIEFSMSLAHRWLEKKPRPVWYKVSASSENDGYRLDKFFQFSPSDLKILKAWRDIPGDKRKKLTYFLNDWPRGTEYESEDDTTQFDEYLKANRLKSYIESEFLKSHVSAPIIESVDLMAPVSITEFRCTALKPDGTQLKGSICINLTDDEYCQILAECIMNDNETFNDLARDQPELANRIKSFTKPVSMGFCRFPYIISLEEFNSIANAIVDPQIDVLGIQKDQHTYSEEEFLVKTSFKRNPFSDPVVLYTIEDPMWGFLHHAYYFDDEDKDGDE